MWLWYQLFSIIMVDKNQQVIDKTLEREYKYGFTTDVDQTKFEPGLDEEVIACLLYTSPSPRDQRGSRMPSSA